ncbi:CpaF family protein [Ruminococcus sp. Marseille-P328]|jgi:pilus assembly protein CpaF|uniref:CpaF family protein n=1 Tax=Ruminococcus sp. Marseille-P328 TaxID=1816688 RepID=UPI003561C457
MGIIENKLRSKKQEINQIDQKVSSEQITPTQNERRNINELIQRISSQFRKELTDTTVDRKELDEKIKKCIQSEIEKFPASYEEKRRLEKLAIANIIGLGPIQPLLDNPEITEIVVQRYDNIVVEKNGKIFSTKSVFSDEQALQNVINRILQPVGRAVNLSTPKVDARLEDGSRICATIPPITPKGATLTIRKFNNSMMVDSKYLELGSLSEPMLKFLKKCVQGKTSIFVSGGTGTGKTTFLNMLSAYIPENELLITIEDTLELQLKQKNVRSMETREITSSTMESIDMASLVKSSLRMRPDRIIVGETRDGAVVSLLSAMSTGHEGSMSTGHANSPENLVRVRIPTMMELDKGSSFSEKAKSLMIAEALQLIVQLRRLPNGKRIVSNICSVEGVDKFGNIILKDIFIYDHTDKKFKYTGFFPKKIAEHLEANGVALTKDILDQEVV